MIATKELYANAQTEQAKTQLQRKIDYLDKQINELVYKLYGLTDEEIRIVEGTG